MNCPSCQAPNDAAAETCAGCGGTLAIQPTDFVVTVDLRAGTLFHSRYEILGPLGRGGMGMVYRARDRHLDEVVAIKVLRPDFAQDPRMAKQFKSEIRLARKVRHRNVCTIHDYGEDRSLLYISMELVEGVDLKRLLRDRGSLPTDQAFDISIQLAEGLEAVHEAGIIHRDLKSPNIMIDAQGMARLMDFGIAKRQGEGTLTNTGHIVGTPEYMSPEQAQGGKVDFRSDIYALGIVVFEIFTGRVPFRGETPISTILKHLHEPPPLDGPSAEAIPPAMRRVLRQALEKDPAQRYPTARTLAEAIRQARSPADRQHPVATDALLAPTLAARAVRPRPRPRLMQPWLLVVPVLAVAGGVFVMSRLRTAGDGAEASPPPPVAAASVPVAAPTDPTPPATMPPSTAPSAVVDPAWSAVRTTVPTRPVPSLRPRSPAPGAPVSARPPAPSPTPLPQQAAAAPPPSLAPSPVASSRAEPAAEAGRGMLQVAVIPWGEVVLDGRPVGTTPIDRITVSAGPHTIRVRHPLYEVAERRVVVSEGEVEKVLVNFLTEGVRKPR